MLVKLGKIKGKKLQKSKKSTNSIFFVFYKICNILNGNKTIENEDVINLWFVDVCFLITHEENIVEKDIFCRIFKMKMLKFELCVGSFCNVSSIIRLGCKVHFIPFIYTLFYLSHVLNNLCEIVSFDCLFRILLPIVIRVQIISCQLRRDFRL